MIMEEGAGHGHDLHARIAALLATTPADQVLLEVDARLLNALNQPAVTVSRAWLQGVADSMPHGHDGPAGEVKKKKRAKPANRSSTGTKATRKSKSPATRSQFESKKRSAEEPASKKKEALSKKKRSSKNKNALPLDNAEPQEPILTESAKVLERMFISASENMEIEKVRGIWLVERKLQLQSDEELRRNSKIANGDRERCVRSLAQKERVKLLTEGTKIFTKNRLRELCHQYGASAVGNVDLLRKSLAETWTRMHSEEQLREPVLDNVLPTDSSLNDLAARPFAEIKNEVAALELRKNQAEEGEPLIFVTLLSLTSVSVAMRRELFLAATLAGLHRRWASNDGKATADERLAQLGIESCSSAGKRLRTLHLGMLIERFPALGNC